MFHPFAHPRGVSSPPAQSSAPPLLLPAVPAALLLDKRLTPLERNTWMVLCASADETGRVTSISYTQLRQFLACVPDIELASRETVARTVTVLRLTRWIHTEARTRNPLTGFLPTNHYTVHIQPLPIAEVCQRDLTWATLLEQAFEHASLAVRQVAQHVLQELAAEPALLALMPVTVQARARALLPSLPARDDDDPGDGAGPTNSRETAVADDSGSATSASESEPNGVRNSYLKERTYVSHAEEKSQGAQAEKLVLPAGFATLSADQQRDVLRGLHRLESNQRQSVLDEWAARCRLGQVLKPAAYLFGLIRRALAGEFRLWTGRQPNRPAPVPKAATMSAATPVQQPSSVIPMPSKPVSPEVARQYLAQIRSLLQHSGRPAVMVSGLRPILPPA